MYSNDARRCLEITPSYGLYAPSYASSDKTSETAQLPQQHLRRNAFRKITARSNGVHKALTFQNGQ